MIISSTLQSVGRFPAPLWEQHASYTHPQEGSHGPVPHHALGTVRHLNPQAPELPLGPHWGWGGVAPEPSPGPSEHESLPAAASEPGHPPAPHHHHSHACCKGGWKRLILVRISAKLPCTWAAAGTPGSGSVNMSMPCFHHRSPVGRQMCQCPHAVLNVEASLWERKGRPGLEERGLRPRQQEEEGVPFRRSRRGRKDPGARELGQFP